MKFWDVARDKSNTDAIKEFCIKHPEYVGSVVLSKSNKYDNHIYYNYEVDKCKYRKSTYNDRAKWVNAL